LIGFYPATVGSEEKPSPTGTLKATEVSRNPTYRYNPNYFKGVHSDNPFTIRPGPNNPGHVAPAYGFSTIVVQGCRVNGHFQLQLIAFDVDSLYASRYECVSTDRWHGEAFP
jgi:hypothetical protein